MAAAVMQHIMFSIGQGTQLQLLQHKVAMGHQHQMDWGWWQGDGVFCV